MNGILELLKPLPWNERIRTLRTLKKLTQKQVADKLLTDPRILINWEQGRYEPNTIHRQALVKYLHSLYPEISESVIFGPVVIVVVGESRMEKFHKGKVRRTKP